MINSVMYYNALKLIQSKDGEFITCPKGEGTYVPYYPVSFIYEYKAYRQWLRNLNPRRLP